MAEQKRRWGDRRDATLLRDVDSLHFIMGIIYPNRADNEAYIAERVNLEPIKEYIATKNYEGIPFKYTFFHVILTALVKTVILRPKLNRFYANENYYQRNKVTAGFVIKKEFADGSEEAMALLEIKPESTIETIHEEIHQEVAACREQKKVNTTDNSMNVLNSLFRLFSSSFCCRSRCTLSARRPASFLRPSTTEAKSASPALGALQAIYRFPFPFST